MMLLFQPTTIEDVYCGYHQLTLAELRVHIESIAALGIVDMESAIWAKEKINWDIDHLILAVDKLDNNRRSNVNKIMSKT